MNAKAQFGTDKVAKTWLGNMVESPYFKKATVYALAKIATELGNDQFGAFRIQGAVAALDILSSLANDAPTPIAKDDKLIHQEIWEKQQLQKHLQP